jgi:hypothetical protein
LNKGDEEGRGRNVYKVEDKMIGVRGGGERWYRI